MEDFRIENIKERLGEIAIENLMKEQEIPQIIKIDNTYRFNDLKQFIKENYAKFSDLFFIINTNIKIKGKITNKINEYLNRISLIKVVEEKVGKGEEEQSLVHLKFFNEKINKNQKVLNTFDYNFYIYKMISKEQEFLIFSMEPLELQEYVIKGMEVEMQDMADIGNYTKINLKLPIIFVNKSQSNILKFKNHIDFFSKIPKFTEDQFLSYLLSSKDKIYFKHPRYFEKIIASFILSGKFDSSPYPNHLLIIGPAGSGKSKVMECLHWKFDENTEITDGSCSTMKSLIPSFKSTTNIQPGDLIKSTRICCVDEFLRILVRISPEEREPQLAALNPLLEHKIRNFGSGNYSFKAKMTSKLIAASNPVFGSSDMIRLLNKIDNSFLSRLLIFYQDIEHFKYVTSKDEFELERCEFDMPKELFISIYDYLISFRSKLKRNKINEIYNEGLEILGEDNEDNPYINIRNIYLARYKHHLYCFSDGIVKLRCLCENDMNFEMNDEDTKIILSIWLKIIRNLIKERIYRRI